MLHWKSLLPYVFFIKKKQFHGELFTFAETVDINNLCKEINES